MFWEVKQTGIKDPAAWLVTHRALEKARTAPLVQVEPEASMESAVDISVQLDFIELEPGKLGAAPAKASKSSATDAGGSNANEPDDET